VHACYDLLLDSDLYISGEIIIRLVMSDRLSGAVFESITAVNRIRWPWNSAAAFSAPIRRSNECRLRICRSVARIVGQGDTSHAAIAGRRAAEEYGGVILRQHLEDSSENYTRFLLLTPAAEFSATADSSLWSLNCRIMRALCTIALEPFARRDIDLLKIEGGRSKVVRGILFLP